jgi:hypothetical protein
MQWGDRWQWPGGRGPVRVVHEVCGEEVRVEVRCPHCEREPQAGELRAKPGVRPPHPPGEHEPGHVSGMRLYSTAGGVPLQAGPGSGL